MVKHLSKKHAYFYVSPIYKTRKPIHSCTVYYVVKQRFKSEIRGDIPFTLHNQIQYVFKQMLTEQ